MTWGIEQINDANRYLVNKYYLNEKTYIVPGGTVAQQQFYNLPSDIKKLITVTVTIGSVVWQPKECPTWQDWNALNVQTFYNDFPLYFFVNANKTVGIWPTPSSNSNVITFAYHSRLTDLSMADVTQATNSTTVAITTNTTTVTASGNTFLNWMVGQWIRVPFSSTNSTSGDNNWYQIASVTNATTLVLSNPYSGTSITGASFTIGQVSPLPEDYQDLPLFRMGMVYYSTRLMDSTRYGLYKGLYETGESKLNDEFGSKTSNIILTDVPLPIMNPNLFQQNLTKAN